MTAVRVQQGVFISLVLLGPVVACSPRVRPWVLARPIRVLAIILGLDLAYMLWATVPFVPYGVDESYLVINSLVYRGSDLYLAWMRPPLPGLGAALCPAHPPLIGLLLKSAAGVLVYRIAVRPLGPGPALLAVWLCVTSTRLSGYSSSMLTEPYGAAALTAFALVAARGAGAGAGLVASLGFLSRWPLGFLWPIAAFLGFRKRRYRGAVLATVLFLVPAALLILATGAEPWKMLGGRSEGYWHKSPVATFAFFLAPSVGLGLGLIGMLAALLGAATIVRDRDRSPELAWCLALFAVNLAILTAMGEAVVRFLAPAAPIGCVLVVVGLKAAAERGPPLLGKRALAGPLAGAVAAVMCIPVQPPKLRMQRLDSPQNFVREHRARILEILGDAPLYSDTQFLALTAILDHPVHAVLHEPNDIHRNHPWGVDLDWEGRFPARERGDLPAGVLYLTYDPGGREVLWHARELYLIRW